MAQKGTKKRKGLVKGGPQLASERPFASSLCPGGAGHTVGVQQRFVELIILSSFVFELYLLSAHTHSTYWVLAQLVGLGVLTIQSVKDPCSGHSNFQSTFLVVTSFGLQKLRVWGR